MALPRDSRSLLLLHTNKQTLSREGHGKAQKEKKEIQKEKKMAGVLTGLKQAVHSAYLRTADRVMPTLSESRFADEGVLTPEEFVAAGDLLVFQCKTWSWEAGDPDRAVPYLPREKQFLITRNVRCAQRCSALEAALDDPAAASAASAAASASVVFDDGEEWVTPIADPTKDDPVVEIAPASAATTAVVAPMDTAADDDDDDDDDAPVPDMESFEGENLVDDDPSRAKADATAAAAAAAASEDTIDRVRTYDISITYDHYYRTPRVWLFGYDEQMRPLTPAQVFEDVSADHAHKTVTFDAHPHLGIAHAYIHPCKHAAVMKKIIASHAASGRPPLRVDQYLILFLKFINSAVPTIEYDNTYEVS